jgi:hypothetical protein
LNDSASTDVNKSWAYAYNIWIEETISELIMGVILIIKSDLNFKNVWLGVWWYRAHDCVVSSQSSGDKNTVLTSSKSNSNIRAVVVGAIKVGTADSNGLTIW